MTNLRAHLACTTIVIIWSGWITISRYGVQTTLQPADITLLRYSTALFAASPMILRYDWSRFRLYQYLLVGLGIGFPYTMTTFYGLQHIKAAHAGVLVNGMLPVFGAAAAWLFLAQSISAGRYLGIAIIFVANFIMAGGDTFNLSHGTGILLLLSAAVVYTVHMVGVKRYLFEWKDVIVTVPVVNVAIFLPLWFLFPSGLMEAKPVDIITQSLYQGVLVNIFALMCSTYAIKILGTVTVSIYYSVVPVITAILAWIVLGEDLNVYELVGIGGCTFGLFVYSYSQRIEARRQRLM